MNSAKNNKVANTAISKDLSTSQDHSTAMHHKTHRQFLGDDALLANLFHEADRPSRSWLRDQRKARKIPYIKIARQIFYDPEAVRQVLAEHYTIKEVGQ